MAHVEPLREDDPAAVGIYRLLGRLGSGGQGTVYLGQAPDGREVAVKVLRHGVGFGERFAKEIEAARRVEPFCIAQVLDASLGAQPYIVTEYVEGPSLHQAGRHTGADLQRLAVATATALAAIHQAGVVHRDFKPANVLLGPGGPRVIDFGIARAMDDAVTHTSGIVGTPAYMAPEQLAGQPVGPPADVFAWASVMVWAGTETPPFGQDTLPAIINRILNNEPQLGDLPVPLRAIVYDCLAKDPRVRPTMRDVILRLLSGQNPAPGPQQGFQGPGSGLGPSLGSGPMAGSGPMPMAGPAPMGGPGSMPGPNAMPGVGPGMPGPGPGAMPGVGSQPMGMPGHGPGPIAGAGPGPMPMSGPGHASIPGPGHGPGPGLGPMRGPGQGPGPMQGPGQGSRSGAGHRGRGRVGIPVAVGVSGVMVAALVGGAVWLAPWPGKASPVPLAAISPTASSAATKSTPKPTSTSPKPRKTPRKTPKPTQSATETPTRTPTTASKRPTPTPAKTTKKPVANTRFSVLEIDISGGPGQSESSDCYMPPIHMQSKVESNRNGIWFSHAWDIDGKTRDSTRSWVSEDEYTTFVTSGQYMLDAGSHTITLRVTSPSTARRSITIKVCPVEEY